jgi:hypothetical protein
MPDVAGRQNIRNQVDDLRQQLQDKTMSDKNKPESNENSSDYDDARGRLENMINDREREYELQMDVQAQLTRIQDDLYTAEDDLGQLDYRDPDFSQDQADVLKVLCVLHDEIDELRDSVGENLLNRIGLPYFSANDHCQNLIKRVNDGEFEYSVRPDEPRGDIDLDWTSSVEKISGEPEPACDVKKSTTTSRKGGYISSISIENFKGIGEKVTIPLKPITLMFGANSAGKSTVLQAMQVVSELLKNRRKFYANGASLGSFFDMVHNHDLQRKIKIGFNIKLNDDGIGLDDVGYINSFSIEFEMGASWHQSEAHIYFEDKLFCKTDVGNQDLLDVELAESHTLIDSFYKIHGEGFFDDLHWDADETEVDDTPLPVCFVLCSDEDEGEGSFADGTYSSMMGKNGDSCEEDIILPFLQEYALRPILILMTELGNLRHVGPIREIPAPGLDLYHIEESSWFNGLAAWKLGLDELKWHSPDPELRPDEDRSSEYFVRTVNALEWFEYELAIQGQAEFKLSPEVYASLSRHDITEEERSIQLLKGLQGTYGDSWPYNAIRDTLVLRHKQSRVIVEPSAVGTGISQVYPVIVAAVAEKAQFVAVEQPELHIHPRMQCELGDLFISQMHHYPERTFLLETHSEHLILRLLRRIRETASNELDDPSLSLTPDDVGVLYVDEVESGVRIEEIPINEEGDFTRKWPKGFFDERAEELF